MTNDQSSADEPVEHGESVAEEEIRYADGRIEHPGVRYEPKDIRLGCLLAVVVAAGCVLAVMGYLVWRFYWSEAAAQAERKKSPYPMAPAMSEEPPWTPSPGGPYQPRLEQLDRMSGDRSADVYQRLADKEKTLNSYGASGEKGFVHIPIQQAIKAVAGTLPVAKEPSQGRVARSNGLVDGGASNSGRMFREPSP